MLNKSWKPVALVKLEELRGRLSEIKKAEEIYVAIDALEIPFNLKHNIMSRVLSMGIVLSPVPGFAIYSPEKAISSTIEEIRNYSEKEN